MELNRPFERYQNLHDTIENLTSNLLGLTVTTSNIQAQLIAQTGDGQILGNLLYNVANLLNPGGSLSLLTILNLLGL